MEYDEARDTELRHRGWALLGLVAAAIAAVKFGVPSLDQPEARTAARAESQGPPVDERGDRNSRAMVLGDVSPAVAHLDPDLRAAFRRAALDAQRDGVVLHVTSGWRSAAHQQELLDRAVSEYGSRAEALRWVSTPETSAHVTGDAVDIGHDAAIAWLARHGASYDLCQIYRNEPWHYELRAGAATQGCPAMYADPTHDPRMQR